MKTKIRWILPVVTQKKKIYTEDNDLPNEKNDYYTVDFSNEITEQNEIMENYKNNVDIGVNKYDIQYKKLADLMIPFQNEDSNSMYLTNKKEILTDMDCLIGSLDNFYSSVKKSNELVKRRLLIQKYNLGLMKKDMETLKHGKKVFVLKNLTPNEKVTIQSFMILPEPVIQYSKIDLPSTNILERAQLNENHLDMFRFLNKSTEIKTEIVDDLTRELDFEKIEKDSGIPFLSEIKEYVLDQNLQMEENKLHKFLNAIIPKSKTLIHLFRKYMTDKLSIVSICKQLEPFLIYSKNLDYGQYMEVRHFIKERIQEHHKYLETERSKFEKLKTEKFYVNPKINPLFKLFDQKIDTVEKLKLIYHLKKEGNDLEMFSSELLNHFLNEDNASYITILLSLLSNHLVTPSNILDAIKKANIDDMSDVEKVKSQDCLRRVLAKKYTSIEDVRKDNNTEDVFFDKDYDETPYRLLDKYKEQQKSMPPDEFKEFFIENLVEIHNSPREFAEELATTIIMGKRYVKEGEYAILELKPKLPEGIDISTLTENELRDIEIEENARVKYQYFKRMHNIWVEDKDLEEEYAFSDQLLIPFMETNTLFCNISATCNKNKKLNNCENMEESEKRMKNEEIERIEKEFDKRMTISSEKLLENLKQLLRKAEINMEKMRRLKDIDILRNNNLFQILSKRLQKEDVLESPHTNLLELILGQDDFAKKQRDITVFKETFCREPILDKNEDLFWFYCKETNTKLLPSFYFELANAYVIGGNYMDKLYEVCSRQGEISGDQDSIVDKYSGRVIRKIDFVDEEGYTKDGFKIVNHMVMEKDLSKTIAEVISASKNKERVFENELTSSIYNILYTISKNIDIPLENIEDFSLRIAIELFEENISSKEKYEDEAKKLFEKKNKKLPPYETYRNRNIIFYTSAAFLISIQTAIPSFQTKKTFPNCIRSFSGYPLTGVEDMSGLKYIACVLEKSKSDSKPWTALKGLKSEIMQGLLKTVFEDKIMSKRPDLMNLYAKKREYMDSHPEEISIEDQIVYKWDHFLPPIVNFSVNRNLHAVSNDFKRELLDLIRKGNNKQRDNISVLKSKIFLYGCGVIENINKIVKDKEVLLKTVSKVPFFENSCCIDDIQNPIQYFMKEDNTIELYMNVIKDVSDFLKKEIKPITRPDLFYHDKFTGLNISQLSNGNFDKESLIYSTFFYYLNFDNDLAIPNDMVPLWGSKDKMERYNPKLSLEEKISFMKENGKKYTLINLKQLMDVVYKRSMVQIIPYQTYSQIRGIEDLFESIEYKEPVTIEEPLRKHILGVLQSYELNKMYKYGDDRKEIENLKNYLQTSNMKMYEEIETFLEKNSNLNQNDFTKLTQFITNVTNWSKDPQNEMSELYKITNFVKNSIYYMSKLFPSMILNNTKMDTCKTHWKFSNFHISALNKYLKDYWKELNKFKDNSNKNVLSNLLNEIQIHLLDLQLFVNLIPVESQISKDEHDFYSVFDKETTYYLHTYCWYSVLYEYIMFSDRDDLIQINKEESKALRREKIGLEKDQSYILEEEEKYFEQEAILIQTSDRLTLKQKTCSLLVTFLEMEMENMKTIDLPYSKISRMMRLEKDTEKKKFTDHFAKMEDDARKIEVMLKQMKIGIWDHDPTKYNAAEYIPEEVQEDENINNIEDMIRDDDMLEEEGEDQENIIINGIETNNRDIMRDIFGDDEDEDILNEYGISNLPAEDDFYGDDDDDFMDD